MGQITGKDNNRVPTVEECNDAFGGDYMTESQVNEAISNATANFLSSSDFTMAWGSTSGYIKFPNGFMIQAGYGGRNTTDRQSLSFYTPFPSRCVAVVTNGERSGDGADGYNYVYNVTRYGFEVSWDKSPGYYIAVGY